MPSRFFLMEIMLAFLILMKVPSVIRFLQPLMDEELDPWTALD